MSDQHPIHRDRGRSDVAGDPADTARETFAENEAKQEQQASSPEDKYEGLTDEERTELQEQAAEERFEHVGEDVTHSPDSTEK